MATNLTALSLGHAVMAELHTGMLVLAVVCILSRYLIDVYERVLGPRLPQRLAFVNRFIQWLSPFLDMAGLIGLVGGFIALIIAMILGVWVWENGRAYDEDILHNKIIFSVLATTLWFSAIFIRLRLRKELWTRYWSANLYVIVVLVAMVFTAFAGALGARAGHGHCFFDPFFGWIGWDPADAMTTPISLSIVLTLLGIACLVGYLMLVWNGRSHRQAA